MGSWLQRLRHSRGFGVHSPFAFRFILEVLRENLPYYDYRQLPTRRGRLAFRLAACLQPSALLTDHAPDDLSHAAKLALQGHPGQPPAWTLLTPAPLTIAGPGADPDSLASAVASGSNLMMLYDSPAKLQRVISAIDAGMAFDNEKDLAIIIADRRLPKQTFNLNI